MGGKPTASGPFLQNSAGKQGTFSAPDVLCTIIHKKARPAYPRLVSSGESDAPAATVWVLKRSDRGSVRRYMEKMTGLSRAQTRLITVYLPGTREDIALLAGVAEVHETMSGPAASASASASASAC